MDVRGSARKRVGALMAGVAATAGLAGIGVVVVGEDASVTRQAASIEAPVPASPTRAALPGREIREQRSTYSRTYEQAAGGQVLRLYQEPVNFKTRTGVYRAIDNALVDSEVPGYRVRNAANAYRADLPRELDRPVRFEEGDAWIRFGLRDARGAATLNDTAARYGDALPGVDVEYQMRSEGLKETLHLDGPERVGPYVFDVELRDGLRPRVLRDGTVEIRDGRRVVFGFASPFMVDAAGQVSRAVAVDLDRVDGDWRMTLTPDTAWLRDTKRKFPVQLDPTVIWDWPAVRLTEGSADTYLTAASPTTKHALEPILKAGWTGSKAVRALARFDVTDVIDWDTDIHAAQLKLHLKSRTTTSPVTLNARPVQSSFSENATWATFDGSHPWSLPGGDLAADAYPGTSITATGQWYSWPIRRLVEEWVDRRRPDNGVALVGTETATSTPTNLLSFASANATDPAQRPSIDLYMERQVGVRSRYVLVPPATNGHTTVSATHPDAAPPISVNAATGNLLVHATDAVAGRADPVDLVLDRFYNSGMSGTQGRTGWGWTLGLEGFWLQPVEDGSKVFHGPSGVKYSWLKKADGTFEQTGDGDPATLTTVGDGFLVTTSDNRKFLVPCDDCGVTEYTDAQGDKAVLNYEGQQSAQSITTSAGTTRLTYTNELVSKAVTPQGDVHTYQYDADGYLLKHTVGTRVTTYVYNDDHRLAKITDGAGVVTTFTYDEMNWRRVGSMTRVTDTATGTGPVTQFRYEAPDGLCQAPRDTVRASVLAPDGALAVRCFDHKQAKTGEVLHARGTGERPDWEIERFVLDDTTEVRVNVANGNVTAESADFGFGAAGETLRWVGSHGASTTVGALGLGVRLEIDAGLTAQGTGWLFEAPDGLRVGFTPAVEGGFASDRGAGYTLERTGDTSIVTTPAGTAYEFSGTKLVAVTFDDERRATIQYTTAGAISGVTTPDGSVTFVRGPRNRIATATEQPSGRVWQYTYTGAWLSSVTGPNGTTRYERDDLGNLATVKAPNGVSLRLVHRGGQVVAANRIEPDGSWGPETTFEHLGVATRVTRPEPPSRLVRYGADLVPTAAEDRDAGAPEVELSGPLADAAVTGGILEAGSYDLTIAATDPAGPGVTSIEVLVDGQRKLLAEQQCPAGKCALTRTFTFTPGQYAAGDHTVRVLVGSAQGLHARELPVEVTTAAEYTVSPDVTIDDADLPLPDGTFPTARAAAAGPVDPKTFDHAERPWPTPTQPSFLPEAKGTLPRRMPLMAQDDGVLVRSFDRQAAPLAGADPRTGKWSRTGTRNRPMDDEARAVYSRYHDLGVTWVRFNIWWGEVERRPEGGGSPTYDFSRYLAAIDEARANGFNVYVTLSGAASQGFKGFECPEDVVYQNPVPARGCQKVPNTNPAIHKLTGINPDAEQYGRFVHAAVSTLKSHDVTMFSLWNEPNLDRFFAMVRPEDPLVYPDWADTKTEREAQRILWEDKRVERYRKVYQEGWRRARTAGAKTVLFGELSEQQPGNFLKRTVGMYGSIRPRVSLRTDGVPFHPYEHKPYVAGREGKDYADKADIGISRLKEFRELLDLVYRTKGTTSKNRRLATPKRGTKVEGNRPQIYLTEFGYFNRRLVVNGNLQPPVTAKTEAERLTLYKDALAVAKKHTDVRSFLLYQLAESVPPQSTAPTSSWIPPGTWRPPVTEFGPRPNCENTAGWGGDTDPKKLFDQAYGNVTFDVGMFNDKSSTLRGWRVYGFHRGMKTPCVTWKANEQPGAQPEADIQRRQVICDGIHPWAKANGYPFREVTAACAEPSPSQPPAFPPPNEDLWPPKS